MAQVSVLLLFYPWGVGGALGLSERETHGEG